MRRQREEGGDRGRREEGGDKGRRQETEQRDVRRRGRKADGDGGGGRNLPGGVPEKHGGDTTVIRCDTGSTTPLRW